MVDLFDIEGFLDDPACTALRAELRAAGGGAASLLGGEVRTHVRKATRVALAPASCERVRSLVTQAKPALERHFGLALGECEALQFLRYETGDYFVAHQDGNTPLIHDDSRFRKVSAVVFLSRQSEEPLPDSYGGGSLVLHGPYSGPELRMPLAPPPGTLVAFRAETTHEVTPVTHGERFTIVTWFR
jgi:SM-20-related protein